MADVVMLRYGGRKRYVENQGSALGKRIWEPGDVLPVSQRSAAKLLGFLEFERVNGPHHPMSLSDAEKEVVQAEAQYQAALAQRAQTDNEIALSVQGMGKEALEQLARNYGVELDKRRSLESLRQQVAALVQV